MSIDLYYQQLLEDIREAANRKPSGTVHPGYVPDEIKEKYAGMEIYESRKFSEWFGLEKEMFPPVDKLNFEQLDTIASALAALYYHFNYELGVSRYEQPEVRYIYAVHALDLVEPYIEGSFNIICYCKNDEDNCPFENDCYCYRSKRENPASF